MTSPTTTTTTSGAPLPFVALPQTELLTVNDRDVPWLEDSLGPGIKVKPLRLDMEAGVWVILVAFAPGSSVPLHYHTGEAEVFTLSGRWHYAEYPDQHQTSGSYLFEPAGSVHTLLVPADNAEDTLMIVRVRGANVNFNEDGTLHSILDTTALVFLTDMFAAQAGIEGMAYIRGGEAGMTTAGAEGSAAELPPQIAEALDR
jgi:quercetin dioxygenase-like cupin family protein